MTTPITYETLREILITHVTQEWVTTYPGGPLRTLVEFPNIPFDAPETNIFARLTWSTMTGVRVTFNPQPLSRVPGIVAFDVMAPIRTGNKTIMVLVEHARKMFDCRTVSGLQFESAVPTALLYESPLVRVRIQTPFWCFLVGNVVPVAS
jgi:hypothetical protein